jgi:enterobacterial common antigen flippase
MGDGPVSATTPIQTAPIDSAGAKAVSTGEWRSLVRIMSASAAGATASGLLSAAATKIVAAMAGPAALGLLATLQQLRQTALVAATANGQTALIQGLSAQGVSARGLSAQGVSARGLSAQGLNSQGLSAFPAEARREYLRTVSIVFAAATACSALTLALAPPAITKWMGLDDPFLVRALAAAVALSSLFVFLSALLNALGATGKLALLQLAGPGAMAMLAWPAAHAAHTGSPRVFPLLLAAAAASTVGAAAWALKPYRGTLSVWFRGSGRWWRWEACRHFFSIAAVMLVTGLAGSAALMAARARIIRVQGLAEAGQFDAAWGLSISQVSLVLASLQTHYLPALARLPSPGERGQQIGRVITLAAPVAAAAIALLAVAKPTVLTLFYSAAFRPAAHYLRWTLLGDYLKVASWILSIPMLAAADMRMFLAADLVASGVFAATAAALSPWRGPAEAASIAFLLMHAAHLAICAIYVRLRHSFRWRGAPGLAWSAGLALVTAISIWQWNG